MNLRAITTKQFQIVADSVAADVLRRWGCKTWFDRTSPYVIALTDVASGLMKTAQISRDTGMRSAMRPANRSAQIQGAVLCSI
jgi:hypothetical protein